MKSAWESAPLPPDLLKKAGWSGTIKALWVNKFYSVLVREMDADVNAIIHLCIQPLYSSERPSWRVMQDIKNDLVGEGFTAVEVYPPENEVVDEADMYHLWVLPYHLPFSLYHQGEVA